MKLNEIIDKHKVLRDLAKILAGDEVIDVDKKKAENIYRKVLMTLTKVIDDRFEEIRRASSTGHSEGGRAAKVQGKIVEVWRPTKGTGWIVHVSIHANVKDFPSTDVIVDALQEAGLINNAEEEVQHGDHSTDIFIPAWK